MEQQQHRNTGAEQGGATEREMDEEVVDSKVPHSPLLHRHVSIQSAHGSSDETASASVAAESSTQPQTDGQQQAASAQDVAHAIESAPQLVHTLHHDLSLLQLPLHVPAAVVRLPGDSPLPHHQQRVDSSASRQSHTNSARESPSSPEMEFEPLPFDPTPYNSRDFEDAEQQPQQQSSQPSSPTDSFRAPSVQQVLDGSGVDALAGADDMTLEIIRDLNHMGRQQQQQQLSVHTGGGGGGGETIAFTSSTPSPLIKLGSELAPLPTFASFDGSDPLQLFPPPSTPAGLRAARDTEARLAARLEAAPLMRLPQLRKHQPMARQQQQQQQQQQHKHPSNQTPSAAFINDAGAAIDAQFAVEAAPLVASALFQPAAGSPLQVVHRHAAQLVESHSKSIAPRVRQALARAVERQSVNELTERWLEQQARFDRELTAAATVQPASHGEEEGKQQLPISPRPARTQPTFSPASISSSPHAPKIAGAVASVHPSTAIPSVQLAQQAHARNQAQHEARGGAPAGILHSPSRQRALAASQERVRARQEPLFQLPSTSGPLAPAASAKQRATVPIHVASSATCFYVSADEPPLQLLHPQVQVLSPSAAAASMVSPRHQKNLRQQMTASSTVEHSVTTATSTTVQVHPPIYSTPFVADGGYNQPSSSDALDQFQQHQHQQHQQHSFVGGRVRVGDSGEWHYQLEQHPAAIGSHAPSDVNRWTREDSPPQDLSAHPHTSLPSSPAHWRAGAAPPSAAITDVYASEHEAVHRGRPAAAPYALNSVSSLSAALLRHSGYLDVLTSDLKPLFPGYHAFKSMFVRKRTTVTQEVQRHAHQHGGAGASHAASKIHAHASTKPRQTQRQQQQHHQHHHQPQAGHSYLTGSQTARMLSSYAAADLARHQPPHLTPAPVTRPHSNAIMLVDNGTSKTSTLDKSPLILSNFEPPQRGR